MIRPALARSVFWFHVMLVIYSHLVFKQSLDRSSERGSTHRLARGGDGLGLDGLGSLPESVLKPARHVSQVPHSTGSRRLSPYGLDAPVVLSNLRGWVTARGAHLLLVVKRALSAPGTQRVRLVVALTWSFAIQRQRRDTKKRARARAESATRSLHRDEVRALAVGRLCSPPKNPSLSLSFSRREEASPGL